MVLLDQKLIPLFSSSLEKGGSVENPILVDYEEDKDISPPIIPVSWSPN